MFDIVVNSLWALFNIAGVEVFLRSHRYTISSGRNWLKIIASGRFIGDGIRVLEGRLGEVSAKREGFQYTKKVYSMIC